MAQKIDFANLTQRQCADMHGVDVRTIRRWDDEDEHPKNDDGSYTASASIAWRMHRESGSPLDLQAERARLAKWQADKTEQEVEVRAGNLLPREEVMAWVSNMIVTVKTRLVQIPNAVGQLIDSKYAPVVIAENKRLIAEALEELTAERPSDRRGDVEVGSADGIDGEPVGGPEPQALKRKQRSPRQMAN